MVMGFVGPRMTWNLVMSVVELSTFLKLRACVAEDQRVMLWYVRYFDILLLLYKKNLIWKILKCVELINCLQ